MKTIYFANGCPGAEIIHDVESDPRVVNAAVIGGVDAVEIVLKPGVSIEDFCDDYCGCASSDLNQFLELITRVI